MGAAVAALENYDPNVEPAQWIRHSPSGRRRPDADPSKEYLDHP